MKVPVLLLAFNRPELTEKVIESISIYKPDRLYFALNYPKENKTEDIQKWHQVKNLLKNINWKCKIHKLFRKEHLPLKISVSSAISWFFKNEEMGIILEDDIVADVSFYFFCEYLLKKYKNDSRIGMISGDNFGFGIQSSSYSYYYSIYSHIWGWASWRRAWEGYDVNMNDYDDFLREGFLEKIFPNPTEFQFWKRMFNKVTKENFNTWDFQWVYHNLKNNRLNIMPNVNLVKNIGFGKDASHTNHPSPYANMKIQKMDFPLLHPKFIIRDVSSDQNSTVTYIGDQESILTKNFKFNLLKFLKIVKGIFFE
jgi:hypothetical protein